MKTAARLPAVGSGVLDRLRGWVARHWQAISACSFHRARPTAPPLTATAAAALDFGQRCLTVVNRSILKSYTRNFADSGETEQGKHYKAVGRIIREKFATERYLGIASSSLKYSTGNCTEMALVAAMFAQSDAREFLSARDFQDGKIRAEIYETKSADDDHVVCVINLSANGEEYKVAVDPWAGVSMLYDDYVQHVADHPTLPYTRPSTKFGVDTEITDAINDPGFIERARQIAAKYQLAGGTERTP